MAQCRSCGAEILWKTTKKGSKMPVDWDSELQDDQDEEFDATRMRSHFDTCDQADRHRKQRNAAYVRDSKYIKKRNEMDPGLLW